MLSTSFDLNLFVGNLIGGTELQNWFDSNVHVFEDFRLTFVKKNRHEWRVQEKERLLNGKSRAVIEWKKTKNHGSAFSYK